MPDYQSSSKGYGAMWDACIVNPDKIASLKVIAQKLHSRYSVYEPVEKATGVPKQWTGPTEKRESDCNPNCNIAQGDRWNTVSTHVPRGMGPFTSWFEACIAAYKLPAHKLDKVQRWSVERWLYEWEKWNGYGYLYHSTNSPYVWAWTNHQQPGKYVADGVWSATAWDTQPGCAAMLKVLAEIDPELKERLKNRESKAPPEVKEHETKPGRVTTGVGVGGAAGTGAQKSTTEQPSKSVIHYALEYTAFAIFGAVIVLGIVMTIKKAALLKAKWG